MYLNQERQTQPLHLPPVLTSYKAYNKFVINIKREI